MMLHITGIDLGHSNGDIIQLGLPDGRFDFQMFSEPMDVTAGQMHFFDLMP
jgi:hypothetical protein